MRMEAVEEHLCKRYSLVEAEKEQRNALCFQSEIVQLHHADPAKFVQEE